MMLLLLQLPDSLKTATLLHQLPQPDTAHTMTTKKTHTPEVGFGGQSGLGEIGVRRLVGIQAAIQIIALHQALDSLLDHVDVRLEAVGKLLDHLGDELLVGEMLSLSVDWRVSIIRFA
jgi:hypothetical protein